MFVKSTKKFDRMPTAHCQFFDTKTGEVDYSGHCAQLHGYDRSFTFEFAGIPDEYGWIVPFGDLKLVRSWLEYYFDHTAVVPANDPRLEKFKRAAEEKLIVLRVLPRGVSMEMSSVFVWEHVNAYIMHKTNKRCFVSKIECREHDANSGFVEAQYSEALTSYNRLYDKIGENGNFVDAESFLIKKPVWDAEKVDLFTTYER